MSPRQSAPLTLEHVLLALIDQRPMYGYDLYHELSAMPGISLVWNIKQSLLYALLDKLEDHGLLASRQVHGPTYPPHKDFTITAAGRESLQSWMRSPVRRARELRQEFLAKLIVARRYGPEVAAGLVRAQRAACQDWLAQLRGSQPPNDAPHRDAWLVYSYRINRLECVIDWLETCHEEQPGESIHA